MVRVVLEHLDGLSHFVVDECGAMPVSATEATLDTEDLSVVLGLRTVVAAYLSVTFDVARPRGLVSPERVASIVEGIAAMTRETRARFESFRVSAAGRDSEDMMRLRTALAVATGLVDDPDDGELLIRVRKAAGGGWEVLLRLTPRPLSARAWRTERYEGGLNATIAAAIVHATDPSPEDRFIDMMCGSGTLLVERVSFGPAARVVGYDIATEAIDKTKINLRNAAIRGARVELRNEDVLGAVGQFDKLVVNPPWGTSVGTHEENASLYPAMLAAAARLAAPGATLCALTHEIRIFESALRDQPDWALIAEHRVFQKGHWPRIYVLANS